MKNNKKKYVFLFICIVISILLTVGGIIAYFTDTKEVTNVFTIGNVSITLTEPKWDEAIPDGETVNPNSQNVIPGSTIDKDPTITNVGTNDAYIFVKIEVPNYNNSADPAVATDLFTFNKKMDETTTIHTLDTSKWQLVKQSTTNNVHTSVYAYATSSAVADLIALPPHSVDNTDPSNPIEVGKVVLFDSVTLSEDETVIASAMQAYEDAETYATTNGTELNNPTKINVYAYAIQTSNITGESQEDIFDLFGE